MKKMSFDDLVEFSKKVYKILKGGYLAIGKPFVFATTEFHLDSNRGHVRGYYCVNNVDNLKYCNSVDCGDDFNGTENDALFVLECIKKLASYDNVPETGEVNVNPYIKEFEAYTLNRYKEKQKDEGSSHDESFS